MIEFPSFYGLLARSNEEPIGILTEDFSKGGRYSVYNMHSNENLPNEIETLVGKPIHPVDLATVCFMVNGQRRIGDLEEIRFVLFSTDWKERFSFDDIMKDLDKYI